MISLYILFRGRVTPQQPASYIQPYWHTQVVMLLTSQQVPAASRRRS